MGRNPWMAPFIYASARRSVPIGEKTPESRPPCEWPYKAAVFSILAMRPVQCERGGVVERTAPTSLETLRLGLVQALRVGFYVKKKREVRSLSCSSAPVVPRPPVTPLGPIRISSWGLAFLLSSRCREFPSLHRVSLGSSTRCRCIRSS